MLAGDHCLVTSCSQVITGTGVMLLPLCRTFGAIIAYVTLTGVVDGCYVVLLPTLTEAFTGEDKKVLAWGILNFFASITFTLGPPVAGTYRIDALISVLYYDMSVV